MAIYFFYTSALAKLYRRERGSAAMSALADSGPGRLAVSSLGVLELHWLQQPLTESIFELAGVFLDRHPLRAPDTLQLAACLAVAQTEPVQFVCSDQRLLAAARAEGIGCWDPAAGVE